MFQYMELAYLQRKCIVSSGGKGGRALGLQVVLGRLDPLREVWLSPPFPHAGANGDGEKTSVG